jgi:hypothetical protein
MTNYWKLHFKNVSTHCSMGNWYIEGLNFRQFTSFYLVANFYYYLKTSEYKRKEIIFCLFYLQIINHFIQLVYLIQQVQVHLSSTRYLGSSSLIQIYGVWLSQCEMDMHRFSEASSVYQDCICDMDRQSKNYQIWNNTKKLMMTATVMTSYKLKGPVKRECVTDILLFTW